VDVTRDASSDAALFAFIAARLKGVWSDFDELGEIAEEIGLQLTGRTLRTAPERAARLSEFDRANWRQLFPNTTTVPLQRLNFFEAVVRFRPKEKDDSVVSRIGQVVGVIELLRLERDGDILALVIYASRQDRDVIEAELTEFGEVAEWATVDSHLRDPAVDTWLNLAKRALASARQT
jgi:hypothetical protein